MNQNRQRRYRFVYVSAPTWIVLALAVGLWIWTRFQFEISRYEPLGTTLWALAVSAVAIIAIFQISNLVLLNRPILRTVFNCMLVLIFLALFAAHLVAEHPLDFYFLGENIALFFFPESLSMATNSVTLEHILAVVNLLLIFLALLVFTRIFTYWPQPENRSKNLAAYIILLGLVLGTSLYRHNELTFFARTAFDFYSGRHAYLGLPTTEEYPYVHNVSEADHPQTPGPRPHVFLIMMESFNANFVEARTRDGREILPVFNARLKEGVFVERFYGNSIQTARAALPTLCSVVPSYWGKEATHYPELRARSIAQILKEYGYRTLFFRFQQSLEFDNAGDFMQRMGFDERRCMDAAFAGTDVDEFVWGWGLQDNHGYDKVFRRLDDVYAQEQSSGSKSQPPCFVMVETISHHYPFTETPVQQRFLHPAAVSRKEDYENSIHLADRYLARFFDELESREYLQDSIVIITGDHSFPAGEHGNYYNENCFYEENFRVPLLVWWPGKLTPRRIQATSHSQLDIAPTLLDLLHLKTRHHFQGTSIVDSSPSTNRAIHLIQPYDGTHLCVVKYPYKYVESIRVPGRYLYRLDEDPREEHNVIDQFEGTDILSELQHEVKRIHLNQQLIQHNRIWPP